MPVTEQVTREYTYFDGNTSVRSFPFNEKPLRITVKQERGLGGPVSTQFDIEQFKQYVTTLTDAYAEMEKAGLL
jgi:hypothetical protein